MAPHTYGFGFMGWTWLNMVQASLLWPMGVLAMSAGACAGPEASPEKAEPQTPAGGEPKAPYLRLVKSG
jgi:hypothetical protein